MLQTRLQSIPIMALLSIKEQQQQRGPGMARSSSSSAVQEAAAADSPGSLAERQRPQELQEQQPRSPTQRQQVQQRGPLIEDRRLVQLFKSRVARLASA